jgi:hypothetical protein
VQNKFSLKKKKKTFTVKTLACAGKGCFTLAYIVVDIVELVVASAI